MKDLSLEQIVKRAILGEEAAFTELCERKAKSVLYVCIKLMGNRADGEDAAQEVLLKMHTGLPGLKNPASFTTWLNRIIAYTCSNLKRDGFARRTQQASENELDDLAEVNTEFLPTELAERREEREQVARALERLPYKYREVLVLFYYSELSLKQVAEALETSLSTIDHRLRRARAALKKELERGMKTKTKTEADKELPAAVALPVLTQVLRSEAEMVPARSVKRVLRAVGATAATAGAATYAPRLVQVLQALVLALGLGAAGVAAVTIASSPALSGGDTPLQGPVPQQSLATSQPEDAGVLPIESMPHVDFSAAPQVPSLPAAGPGPAPSVPDTGPGGDAGGEQPPQKKTPPEAPGASPEPVAPVQQTLAGRAVFLDNTGREVPGAAKYAAGFGIEVRRDGALVAALTLDEGASYTLTLDEGGYELYASRPAGAGGAALLAPVAGEGIAFTVTPGGGTLPDLYITDTSPPGGVIRFSGGSRNAEGHAVNPAGVSVAVTDETHTETTWRITAHGGGEVAAGTGEKISLSYAGGSARGSWYTIEFTIRDAAGNETVAARDFVAFIDR